MSNDYLNFVTRQVLPAINKYGFYFTSVVEFLDSDTFGLNKEGLLTLGISLDLDVNNKFQKLTLIYLWDLVNDGKSTLEKIKESNAHKTLPPAFESLYKLGIEPKY